MFVDVPSPDLNCLQRIPEDDTGVSNVRNKPYAHDRFLATRSINIKPSESDSA